MAASQMMVKIVFFVFIGFPAARAQWGLVYQEHGYMGETAVGGIYSWNDQHSVELSLGRYFSGGNENHQINFGYRWSPWKVQISKLRWAPVQVGVFALATLNEKEYFTESPTVFPSEDYYDQTAVRTALQLSSTLYFAGGQAAVVYHLSILENGLIAMYNNNWQNLKYFWSSGLGLQFFF
jgi:hypothetical protein